MKQILLIEIEPAVEGYILQISRRETAREKHVFTSDHELVGFLERLFDKEAKEKGL